MAEQQAAGPGGAAHPGATVRDVGEDPLVSDAIARYPGAPWLVVGPGDDAAVLDLDQAPGPVGSPFAGRVILCTDTLVEDEDFRRSWSDGYDVGVKVAAQNFADVAAMGGRPGSLVVSLVMPPDLPAAWAGDLADGLADECGRAGAVVSGGDVSAGLQIVVTGTAFGLLDLERAVLRSGARPGDVVAVAGVLGHAAAGLDLLEAGLVDPRPDPVLDLLARAQLRPRPPYDAGPAAARAGATAMIDTSDGLLRDAQRLARSSGADLDLDRSALAPDDALTHAAAVVGARNPGDWVLAGGEDHALLACFPPDATLPAPFRRIGSVLPARAAGEVMVDGVIVPAGGWKHFRERKSQ